MRRPRWYGGGLPFRCTECGACCRREGTVWLTIDEVPRIADALLGSADPAGLIALGGVAEPDGRLRFDVPTGGACPLLDGDGRCRVHAVKPTQCRTYPFWDEVVGTRRAWLAESLECEGIGEGEVVDSETIESLRRLAR
ncbi:MAG: YkgJ family cysteine cluster protein [Myxococcales bacterium]|nr:YkgJ family cysteine cluster protein [Myxococcales bacterium]MCB9531039.1 YkgJ family cysteine cluster protein [Myxococcales bacterium]MCB9532949.1 YkgJ family cysteine cluster protein [Myxococcales bacterium]